MKGCKQEDLVRGICSNPGKGMNELVHGYSSHIGKESLDPR